MPLVDPIELLRREDKWYLGNGGMLLYAPPFPRHLHTPGFWDECHFGDLALPRLLCVSIAANLGDGLIELFPYSDYWNWRPDRIEARYYLVQRDGIGYKQQRGVRVFLNETRSIGPDGTLYCELGFDLVEGCKLKELHIVAWTVRQSNARGRLDNAHSFNVEDGALSYIQPLMQRSHGRGDKPLSVQVTMSASRKPASFQVTPSHSASITPHLAHTPLWDALRQGRLSNEVLAENALGSLTYAGLHFKHKIMPGKANHLRIQVSVRDSEAGSPVGQASVPAEIKGRAGVSPAMGSASLRGGVGDGGRDARPTQGLQAGSPAPPDPARAWRQFLSLVPHFECSDQMLTRYYWYRWYGIRLNTVPAGGNYVAPAVTEGIDYFRGVISYSLMCHINECKWLADPTLAQGCLRNHLAHQAKSGHFPGHIYVSHANLKGFYHTDAGRSVGELLAHHPSEEFAKEITSPLQKLLRYYIRERDQEGLGLYDIRDQYETGQEFASRYFHADAQADRYGWEHKLKLKGVDVTAYVYHLVRLLLDLALQRKDARSIRKYSELAERIKAAVRTELWDGERRFFFDYSAQKKSRSPYMAAVGFYPLLSDLASDEQALAAASHLDDPAKFATPWPTPTAPVDDEHFSAEPRWRGERANCPWNGRVWPMLNSHICDVLARLAALEPKKYRGKLAAYLRRFIEMMHFEGSATAKDFNRPNCFEHYHPSDGTASEYRGIDDYMHSWVADLILKYVCGVRLEEGKMVDPHSVAAISADGGHGVPPHLKLIVDPFPFKLEHFLLKNCTIAGHKLEVCWNRDRRGRQMDGYRVYLDDKTVFKAARPARFEAGI